MFHNMRSEEKRYSNTMYKSKSEISTVANEGVECCQFDVQNGICHVFSTVQVSTITFF